MHYRQRLRLPLAVLLAGALLTSGCGGDASPGTTTDSAPDHAAVAEPLEILEGPEPNPVLPTVVESADGTTTTVESAERIVPLSGALSEVVYTLGLGDRVVARDVTATFEEVADLPVVTRGHEISAESVLSVHPDVVLVDEAGGPTEAVEQIRAAGIPVVVFETPRELAAVSEQITSVAAALGVADAGDRLAERTETRIADARGGAPDEGERPRVAFLYLRGSASVYLLGGADSGATSLIEAAGGVDAGVESGLEKDFTPITSEALVAAAPDVILVMSKGLESVDGVDGLLEIPGVAETPAGRDRRVASLDDGVLLTYGPRTDQVVSSLVEQLHAGTEAGDAPVEAS